uniref:septal ring lytic transglycosylase RlpA family protein n=1 Tax=Thaumasiovibrio occultus TaxID=1891184 RepID=UPI000B350AA1|nr:septal ring lytic transglycosylase RlpA family protein [Thaumasiovibrio occultus]
MRKILPFLLLALVGCESTTPESDERYTIDSDVAPEFIPAVVHQIDAQPRYEPYSLSGNRNYTLRGQRYEIIQDPEGFTQEGRASWYGEKFHGHRTSNGEIYDMYSMTAAHKTLPLPSYVKVTNLNNNQSVVVRVNDRGPFHQGRIIDLSYAAARKIGVIETGTAPVKIEVITVDKPAANEAHIISDKDYFVQVAAVTEPNAPLANAKSLAEKFDTSAFALQDNKLFRIRMGPFDSAFAAKSAQEAAENAGFNGAYVIELPRKTRTQ